MLPQKVIHLCLTNTNLSCKGSKDAMAQQLLQNHSDWSELFPLSKTTGTVNTKKNPPSMATKRCQSHATITTSQRPPR